MKNLSLIVFFLFLSSICSKTITAKDLSEVLSSASPGDTIEFQFGTYSQIPYRLSNGSSGKPITIKAEKGGKVVFTGTNTMCIFDFRGVSYASIEGIRT